MMTPTMTVQQLIDALSQVADKSRLVRIEGCDCDGDAGSVDAETDGAVYIQRTEYADDDDDD